jgi:hypothetical protein
MRKLDSDVKNNALKQFRNMLELHPFTDYLEREEGFDVYKELRKIEESTYENEYDFYYALFALSERIPDSQTLFYPPIKYRRFKKLTPYYMYPSGSSNKVFATKFNGLYTRFLGNPPDILGSQIVSINGIPIVDWMIKNSRVFSKDRSLKFNYYLLHQEIGFENEFSRVYDRWNPVDVYKLANGTEVSINVAYSISGILSFDKKDEHNAEEQKKQESKKEEFKNKQKNQNNGSYSLDFKKFGSDFITRSGLLTNSRNKKIPVLSISSFGVTKEDVEVFTGFINDIVSTNSRVSIIDLRSIYPYGNPEWLINLLSNTYPQVYENPNFKSSTYFTLRDARLTSYASKFFYYKLNQLNQQTWNLSDPTSGERISNNLQCHLESPIRVRRSKSDQLLSPLSYQRFQPQEFFRSTPLNTKFYIITDGDCEKSCSFFVNAMRSRNLANFWGWWS